MKFALLIFIFNFFASNAAACHLKNAAANMPRAAETAALPQNNEPPACGCCVFDEAPPDLWWQAKIADAEPGERMTVKGVIYESDGTTPAKNVSMYFYHTNAQGIYAKRADEDRSSHAWWHGYNRGWLKTNERGEYEINTIKPAPYPTRDEPAHIHAIVKARSQKYCAVVQDFVFKGDELLTKNFFIRDAKYYESLGVSPERDYAGVELKKGTDGVWRGTRNLKLYAEYDLPKTESGAAIGESNPAFEPQHVWGADKNSRACPMCVYGNRQGVLFWINSDADWQNAKKLAQSLDAESERRNAAKFKAYLIYTNPNGKSPAQVEEMLTRFAAELNLKNIAVTYVPSPTDADTAALNKINPSLKNTVIVFKKRKVFDKFIEFEANEKNLKLLTKAIDRAENSVAPKITRQVYQAPLLTSSGAARLKIKINNNEITALINTGSPASVQISAKLAARLRAAEIANHRLQKLMLGDYERRNVRFSVVTELVPPTSEQPNVQIDAILGWEFLSQNYFAVDYKNQRLQISEAPLELGDSKMSFNFSAARQVPVVTGTLNGRKINFLVDTSASSSVADYRIFGEPFAEKNVTAEMNVEGYRLPTDWKLQDLSGIKKPFGGEAVIGGNLLGDRVYFETKNNLLFVY